MNLQNLVDYCEGAGLPSPFSGANVPDPLNLETVVNAIMIRCGLLTPVYPEPEVFREMTRHWFDTKQWTFEHLIKVIQSEYSPIENVFEERTETTDYNSKNITSGGYTDTSSGKDTVSDSGTDSEQLSGTDARDIRNSGTDSTTNTISAFNSATYQPDNQSETTHGHDVDDDITYGKKTNTTYGKQSDTTYGKQIKRVNDETASRTGKDTLSVNRHGNVGVTTSQQLINEELELLRHFDIYSYIAKLFEEDMFIMIY